MKKTTKYEKILRNINRKRGKFTVTYFCKKTDSGRNTVKMITKHMQNLGMVLRHHPAGSPFCYYTKTDTWDFQRALEETKARLKRKGESYKNKKAEKCAK